MGAPVESPEIESRVCAHWDAAMQWAYRKTKQRGLDGIGFRGNIDKAPGFFKCSRKEQKWRLAYMGPIGFTFRELTVASTRTK